VGNAARWAGSTCGRATPSIYIVPYTTARWRGDGLQRPQLSVAASVTRFTAAGLVVAVVVTVITGVLARRTGSEEAIRSFERLAAVVAGSVLLPRLTPALRHGDPVAEALVRGAAEPLLAAGPVVRIVVLDAAGRVVWSSVPGSVGEVVALRSDQRRALDDGSVVSAGGQPAGGSEADLLTASAGVTDTGGVPLLVQVSERHDDMEANARITWRLFAPAWLGALLVLQLVQIPIAWNLARRVRRHQEAEAALLEAALEASDVERRRIAGDVHDNILPGLTGLAYELDAARLSGQAPAPLLDRTADGVRRSIAELRALSVDLSHQRLRETGLGPALAGLAARMEARGTQVTVEATGLDELPRHVAEVLYRCVQEILRNVAAHSGAEQVEIRLTRDTGDVTMIVDDDGRGFDEARLSESEDAGHLGLRALGDLVADAGGALTTFSAPGRGTRVVVRVPLDPVAVSVGGIR
jgi:two-component system, NarL family, sensor kinase